MKRELIEYIEACDRVDKTPCSDEVILMDATFVFLSPMQIFKAWWFSFRKHYL